MSTATAPIPRIAVITVGAFIALNIVFYLLSAEYFESHTQIVPGVGAMPVYSADQEMHVRVTFAVFSGIVAALGFAAAAWARLVGHLLPLLLSLGQLAGAIAVFTHGAPGVIGMVLLVSGVLMPVLIWHSYRRSRAAWAFLVAICSVFAVVGLFGAPKIRAALDLGLWLTMIGPGLYTVAAAGLISLRSEYVERDTVAA